MQKLQKQIDKYGGQYLGPLEEDHWWRLFFFQPYRPIPDKKDEEQIARHKIVLAAVEAEEHQVQRTWLELFTDLIFVAVIG